MITKTATTINLYSCNVCKTRDHAEYAEEPKGKLTQIILTCKHCKDTLMKFYKLKTTVHNGVK